MQIVHKNKKNMRIVVCCSGNLIFRKNNYQECCQKSNGSRNTELQGL